MTTIQPQNELTPDAIVDSMVDDLIIIKDRQAAVDAKKEILRQMRNDGLIGDKYEHELLTLTWQTTKRWVYSPAIKKLQDLEKVDGSATQTTSENWVARPNKPTL